MRRLSRRFGRVLSSVLTCAALAQSPRPDAGTLYRTAVADLRQGRVRESVAGFDQLAAMAPDWAPQFWQRGIALYFAGRYKDCRGQFESHRTVNPNDVENAVWHFLCVARAESPEKARKALLPVGADARVPMREVLQMFRGETQPAQVLAAAGGDTEAQFHAHLYTGLYFEATGRKDAALREIRIAADPRYKVGGYMHDMAVVHLQLLTH